MMERLTEKRDGQNVIPLRQDGKHKWSLASAGMGDASTQFLYGEFADKLAEYEDLEEQGLLLRLPCKVGSPLYRVYKKPTKCTAYGEYKYDYVCQGCEKECDSSYIWAIYKYKADIKTIVCLSDEIGKTVFLTQAEAEQKLKEMESD